MKPEFTLTQPVLEPGALALPGQDRYRISGVPVNTEAVALVARMGGVPSAVALVPMGQKVSEVHLAAAQAEIDTLAQEAIESGTT